MELHVPEGPGDSAGIAFTAHDDGGEQMGFEVTVGEGSRHARRSGKAERVEVMIGKLNPYSLILTLCSVPNVKIQIPK